MNDLLAQSIFSSQRRAGRVDRVTGLGSGRWRVLIRGCVHTPLLLQFTMSLTPQACDKFDEWRLSRLRSLVSSLHSCRANLAALQSKIAAN
ncbi:hypothetical protein AVEN_242137-1 [Araneus ventricosus]|uniref:Uncharacterized protein n=1 Tax=Araneus ventricosus TaxID=182803 RepID=A0A4Y2J2L5_ARAVE|nr:hypothetical protein AVEN_242137-1 [Araneus ventricosus]